MTNINIETTAGLTSISQGNNITLSPNPITGTGTITGWVFSPAVTGEKPGPVPLVNTDGSYIMVRTA